MSSHVIISDIFLIMVGIKSNVDFIDGGTLRLENYNTPLPR